MITATENAGSTICLKKVGELLKDASGAPAVYHVADYQRGYRWTPQQVTQLLDDLREFREHNGSDEDAFYCLQPLVIKRTSSCLEVVDGQQRLTTILLILTFINQGYVENRRRALFSLSFETRSGFAEFLESPRQRVRPRLGVYRIPFHPSGRRGERQQRPCQKSPPAVRSKNRWPRRP